MPDTTNRLEGHAPERSEAIAFVGLGLGVMSFLSSLFAVGLAVRAANEARDALEAFRSSPPAAAAEAAEAVTLDDFSIEPGDLVVSAGAVLTVENVGAVTHNLSVDGAASPMIDGGGSAQLDLSGLAPGTYEMRCDVPGHAAAGMTGSLTVD